LVSFPSRFGVSCGQSGELLPTCYKRLKISLALDGVFEPRFAFMGR